jgi:hypothetical protein
MARTGKSTGKGRTSREGLKLLERRIVVFERWRTGESLADIAKALTAAGTKISKQTAGLDVQLSLNEWREKHRGSINEQVEHDLRRLNRLELKAEQKLDSVPDKCLDGADWARIILDCSKERRRLLGIDAPSRREIKADVTISRSLTRDEMHQQARTLLERFRERQTSN